MKIKQLRAKLIKTLLALLVFVMVSAAIYFVITSYSQSLTEGIAKNEEETTRLIVQKNTIKERVGLSEKAVKFYDDYKTKNGEGDKFFRREALRGILLDLKEDMLLGGMEYTLEPFAEKDGNLRKESAVMISSKVTIQFTSPTDVIAYKAFKELQNMMPGFMDVASLEITKTREFQPQDIIDINSGKSPPVVKCALVFDWLGIRDLKSKESVFIITQPTSRKNAPDGI